MGLLCVPLQTDIAQKVPAIMSSTSRQTSPRPTSKKTAASSRAKKIAPVAEAAPEPEITVVETIAEIAEPVVNPFLTDMVCAFDRAWYEREYPDVAAAGFDAATHYRETGYREGRQPNRFFNSNDYRAANPDLQEYDGDLFLHFIFYGIQEGRRLR
ncbi:hypothetical protein Gbth_028_008 [Gluconobacter thailandicus F149-1 = NBRC 100600]|uniref:Uncharacterized protein n=3 Tax=Gluconobacter thailandicus TaxID=257438 RepID=A0AAP9ET00_GLUTH|nr:hypothetical protein AD946_09565 [Gluconobacter thailandicus]GAC86970.1 hypothetical protein NBRC3255_0631 [Gluconobacter thailandicus NBRC 3255]GAD27513.1 hypothetical protein NBRC3257_2512 [Gluconobacter thailandicus NBRC 3257]GAN93612.1 hypothetical protein Gbth_028_008 [Gluconobacter thailandicus F149-1 = NBRC 100600]QEH96790.1 hypothetical protein FXF46_11090 [Gluconobacter thailandicus]